MTVLFAVMPDMGHVGYLLPLIRQLIQDGHRVEFWSGKQAAPWLPEGTTFREIFRRKNCAAPFCMAFAHGSTNEEAIDALKRKVIDKSIWVPEGYDWNWASFEESDKMAMKERILQPDVELVVDDMAHILDWVGPFAHEHGVPTIRLAPSLLFLVLARQGLMSMFMESCSLFSGLNPEAEDSNDQDRTLQDPSSADEEREWPRVRHSAPQHRFFTIAPDFLKAFGVDVDDKHMFQDHKGQACQALGFIHDPNHDVSQRQAFKDSGLEAWCDEAPFIYLSLGSMVVQCVLSQAEWCTGVEKLLDSLSNRRLLTNFSLPGYCQRDNLKMAGWVPQRAVLAHVNIECFITHCGQGAVSEALQHGVPIVAYPFFHDQIYLAEAVETLGCGARLQRLGHGPGVPIADAEHAVALAVAARQQAIELRDKARIMDGFGVVYAKIQEFIQWSKEHPTFLLARGGA
jgi:hypothetical protein